MAPRWVQKQEVGKTYGLKISVESKESLSLVSLPPTQRYIIHRLCSEHGSPSVRTHQSGLTKPNFILSLSFRGPGNRLEGGVIDPTYGSRHGSGDAVHDGGAVPGTVRVLPRGVLCTL